MAYPTGERPELVVDLGDVLLPLADPPETNSFFNERSAARFVHSGDGDFRFRIDDIELPASFVDGKRSWVWRPGFYAGEVAAELVDSDGRIAGSWRLDVSPDPDKLGCSVFEGMVDDILEVDPALILGQESARTQIGSLGATENPLVALARFRLRYEKLGAALSAICQRPIRTLSPRRQLVPIHAARRADRYTALSALRHPALLAAAGVAEFDLPPMMTEHLVVDVPTVKRQVDCSANRCAAQMLGGLIRRSGALLIRLQAVVDRERESETVTPLAVRWPIWKQFLTQARHHLIRVSRRSPFVDIAYPEVTAAGLNAVSAHPLYARFWRLAWKALNSGIDGTDRSDLLHMSPTWEIYERWCFLRLGQTLREWLPDLEWHASRTRTLEGVSQDCQVNLELQPEARGTGGIARESVWSVSRRRVPDIVLSWSNLATKGFIVLDAKYSVTRANVLAAMESAHIYQDSLRMSDRRPNLSVLLVPEVGGAPWLEEGSFAREHRVAVSGFGPRRGLADWLSSLVKASISGA